MKNRKQPLFKSFGYAFDFKREEYEDSLPCSDSCNSSWNLCRINTDGMVYLSSPFWNGDLTGTCEYGSGSCCRSCDRREKATC